MTNEEMRSKSKDELLAFTTLKSSARLHQLAAEELRRRENDEAEKFADARNTKIERHLEELKKSHWTVVPTFWFALISAIAAILGIVLFLLQKP